MYPHPQQPPRETRETPTQRAQRGTRWDILGEMERSPKNFRKAFSWEIDRDVCRWMLDMYNTYIYIYINNIIIIMMMLIIIQI